MLAALNLGCQPSVLKHHYATFWGSEAWAWLGVQEFDEEIGEEGLTPLVALTETGHADANSEK